MERRKRVMQRSIRLGHCVCDPKKPCPCDLFKEKNVCLCAGERLDGPTGPVRLTELIEKPGCASKIDQAFLKEVLKGLPAVDDPNVLIGFPAGDDAGVYDLGDGRALVQTVDVFTPSVDDPYLFGQIAAANSVSDVYAMGGKPLTALSVLGFPVRKIADKAMSEMLRGGMDKMAEAGVAVIGGHSINDPEVKAGFAVTGIIETERIASNSTAKAGDVLILTKPLGTGIVAFAGQIGRAKAEHVEAIGRSMAQLNKTAAELMTEFGASACTDVTGFSLMGHLSELALRSGVDVEVVWDKVPFFDGVLDYVAEGMLPGAIERNKESCGRHVRAGEGVTEEMHDMCFDAQTSGGLLVAIPPDKAEEFVTALRERGVERATVIGRVVGEGKGQVRLETNGSRSMPVAGGSAGKKDGERAAAEGGPAEKAEINKAAKGLEEACCCVEAGGMEGGGTEADYMRFLASSSRPGGLDAFTKQAMNLALSVATRCEPCLRTHIAKAKKMGFADAEIDEAAWMGVSFGGSPAMMMYKQVRKAE
ncbi:selenide, water dikinase SelD [Anaerohalosphaera lusitana]|nr:selenide, water dikinase SelD [Anaerohalosphaera lusitana]